MFEINVNNYFSLPFNSYRKNIKKKCTYFLPGNRLYFEAVTCKLKVAGPVVHDGSRPFCHLLVNSTDSLIRIICDTFVKIVPEVLPYRSPL